MAEDNFERLARLLGHVRRRCGVAGMLLAAAVILLAAVAVFWPTLMAHPWFAAAVDRVANPIPVVRKDAGRFAIAVGRFHGDGGNQQRHLVLESLRQLPVVQVVRIEREVWLEGADEEAAIRRSHALARELLARSGADAMLWGTVVQGSGGSAPSLYWTTARAGADRPGTIYRPDEPLRLPKLFWQELTSVLSLLARHSGVELEAPQYASEELAGVASKVDAVVTRLCEGTPELPACGQLNDVLGMASQSLCDLRGDPRICVAAIQAYERALMAYPLEKIPLEWVRIVLNLGNALMTLGGLSSGTEGLEASVRARRAALAAVSRDEYPLVWATARRGLGASLLALAQRSPDPALLPEAIAALRDGVAADLAEAGRASRTTADLGVALSLLGDRQSDPRHVEEGIEVLRTALAAYARENRPRDWGIVANNLGMALNSLGMLTGQARPFEESLQVLRPALEVRTRERAPMEWAMSQVNLGVALMELGRRDAGADRLQEAVVAFRDALEVYSRERDPFTWAMTHRNLGDAFALLAPRDPEGNHLRRAEVAYRQALDVFTRGEHPALWAALDRRVKALASSRGRAARPGVEAGR